MPEKSEMQGKMEERPAPENLGPEAVVAPSALVRNCALGAYTEIARDAVLVETSLGDYSYVMERSDIIYSVIGKFANIASDVRINPGNHPMEWASQHHFLYRLKQYGFAEEDNQAFFNWRRMQTVTIGHDTWIGHKAVILPGVSIGNGAVVAAGAIVSRDVSPYTVVAGVPARPLRKRFADGVWQRLEAIGWWHWSHETIGERIEDFYDMRRFLQLYGESP